MARLSFSLPGLLSLLPPVSFILHSFILLGFLPGLLSLAFSFAFPSFSELQILDEIITHAEQQALVLSSDSTVLTFPPQTHPSSPSSPPALPFQPSSHSVDTPLDPSFLQLLNSYDRVLRTHGISPEEVRQQNSKCSSQSRGGRSDVCIRFLFVVFPPS